MDKSAMERHLLLADFSATLNLPAFNDAANKSHAVLKTISSTAVLRTLTFAHSGQTLANEVLATDYALTRAQSGELTSTVPLVLGHLVAYPFWRKNQAIFGNIIGAAIMFAFAFAMILREHAITDRLVQRGRVRMAERQRLAQVAQRLGVGIQGTGLRARDGEHLRGGRIVAGELLMPCDQAGQCDGLFACARPGAQQPGAGRAGWRQSRHRSRAGIAARARPRSRSRRTGWR